IDICLCPMRFVNHDEFGTSPSVLTLYASFGSPAIRRTVSEDRPTVLLSERLSRLLDHKHNRYRNLSAQGSVLCRNPAEPVRPLNRGGNFALRPAPRRCKKIEQ